MNKNSKILWGEGLFLRPQHFQQQDAYHESRVRRIAHNLHPYIWGLDRLEIDVPSLAEGIVRVLDVFAIFQDTEIYSAPDASALPCALDLSGLPTSVSDTTIFLAVPRMKRYAKNTAKEGTEDSLARYRHLDTLTPDLFTEAAEGNVSYLNPAVRLLTDDQPREAFFALPLLRLIRSSTGGFEIDHQFVGPSLSLQASPVLMLQLRRLLESLQAKVQALHGTLREPSKDVVEFRAGDIASFWLLHTANTACASLMHLLQHPQFHPERLYQELLRLAGALMTFAKTHQLADLPAYDHMNPGPGFGGLFSIVRALIDTVISARYFSIPLTQIKPAYYQGRLDTQKIDDTATLYLGVSADLAGTELSEIVPRTFKVAAPDVVDQLVSASMPGATLTYIPLVPAAIPIRPGMLYFAVEPRGNTYEHMRKGQTVMLFVPTGLVDLKLELIALTS